MKKRKSLINEPDHINEKFEEYYSSLYSARWETLRKSLLEERPAYSFSQGLTIPYFLDYASVLAARSLRLPQTASLTASNMAAPYTVLDACAAPGGKSLIIASFLTSNVMLLSNELSAERRRRLSDVLDRHLDIEKRRQIQVCGFDAAASGRRKNEHGRFAAILLDAPCSSEEHVLKDKKAYSEWTPARPKFLSQRQWSLLSSAFLLLSEGGSLVYSTCAITSIENDGVVQRLFEKYKDKVIPDPPDFTEGEKTKYGRIILPDIDSIGPLYVARIKKAVS